MIYEYICDKCGATIDIVKPVSEMYREELHCGEPMRRVISTPAIKFVGSGFYVNDYKGK